jgi:hypothetical protein
MNSLVRTERIEDEPVFTLSINACLALSDAWQHCPKIFPSLKSENIVLIEFKIIYFA